MGAVRIGWDGKAIAVGWWIGHEPLRPGWSHRRWLTALLVTVVACGTRAAHVPFSLAGADRSTLFHHFPFFFSLGLVALL